MQSHYQGPTQNRGATGGTENPLSGAIPESSGDIKSGSGVGSLTPTPKSLAQESARISHPEAFLSVLAAIDRAYGLPQELAGADSHEELVTYAFKKILEAFKILHLLLTPAPARTEPNRGAARHVVTWRSQDLSAHLKLIGSNSNQEPPLDLIDGLLNNCGNSYSSMNHVSTNSVTKTCEMLGPFKTFYAALLNASVNELLHGDLEYGFATCSDIERSLVSQKLRQTSEEIARLQEKLKEPSLERLVLTSALVTEPLVQAVTTFNEDLASSCRPTMLIGTISRGIISAKSAEQAKKELIPALQRIQDHIHYVLESYPKIAAAPPVDLDNLMLEIGRALTLFHDLRSPFVRPKTYIGIDVIDQLRTGLLRESSPNGDGSTGGEYRSTVSWPIADRLAGWMGYLHGETNAAYLVEKALWEPAVLDSNQFVIGPRRVLCRLDTPDNGQSFLPEWFPSGGPGSDGVWLDSYHYEPSPWGTSIKMEIELR